MVNSGALYGLCPTIGSTSGASKIDGDVIVAANLRKLEALGVQMLLDDFGSGYSSLRYLHDLPISIVKIDKAFVQGLPDDERSRVIVESTLDLCRRLGKKTVAEGVEEEAALDALRKLGCDMAQGFFIARPMERDDFERWMAGRYPGRPKQLAANG